MPMHFDQLSTRSELLDLAKATPCVNRLTGKFRSSAIGGAGTLSLFD
jgi:hypothetical protein